MLLLMKGRGSCSEGLQRPPLGVQPTLSESCERTRWILRPASPDPLARQNDAAAVGHRVTGRSVVIDGGLCHGFVPNDY